jgi:hypothetical protein
MRTLPCVHWCLLPGGQPVSADTAVAASTSAATASRSFIRTLYLRRAAQLRGGRAIFWSVNAFSRTGMADAVSPDWHFDIASATLAGAGRGRLS